MNICGIQITEAQDLVGFAIGVFILVAAFGFFVCIVGNAIEWLIGKRAGKEGGAE